MSSFRNAMSPSMTTSITSAGLFPTRMSAKPSASMFRGSRTRCVVRLIIRPEEALEEIVSSQRFQYASS